mmetsp:Transcript_141784/g.200813  ORF Transcript_141784/g.200813 Transcript_141784/m.200813 type:complete len:121 (-) Transcript_141784:8-370(-)
MSGDASSAAPGSSGRMRKPRVGLNTSALGSILSSNRRTNARMDRTQFEAAEKELRRVGGEDDVVGCYKQAVEREAKAIEKVTHGRLTVDGDRLVKKKNEEAPVSRRSRSRSPRDSRPTKP